MLFDKLPGVQSGEIEFPGIKLQVTLPENKFFYDGGILSSSINGFIRHIHASLCVDLPATNTAKDEYTFGVCLAYTNGDTRLAATSVLQQNKEYNTFNIGHEATHAAQFLGFEKEIAQLFLDNGYNIDPFEVSEDKEDLANLGGLLSVHHAYGTDFHFTGLTGVMLAPLNQMLLRSRSDA